MSEVTGFLGGLLFAMSAIPLALTALRTRRVEAPWTAICLVVTGSLTMLCYSIMIEAAPLTCNMLITGVCWAVMGVVKSKDYKND